MKEKVEALSNRFLKHEIINYFEIFLYCLGIICFFYYLAHGNVSKTLQPILIASVLTGLRVILRISGIELHPLLRFSILLFIFMAMFMAVEFDFYTIIPLFDKFLHTLSGIMFFFIGLTIFHNVNRANERLEMNAETVVLFCLFFSLAVASCWEIFEFTVDRVLGFHCQRDSLFDTMEDIICGTSGAIFTALYVYLRFRASDANSIISHYLSGKHIQEIGNIAIEKKTV